LGITMAPEKPTQIPGLEEIRFTDTTKDMAVVKFGSKKPILNVWYSDSGVNLIWGWTSKGKKMRARVRVRDSSIVTKPKLIPLHINECKW